MNRLCPSSASHVLLALTLLLLQTPLRPVGAQTLNLERDADTLQRLRAGSSGDLLKARPERGGFDAHTSLGEIMRWSQGTPFGKRARKGDPLLWITGEMEGLDDDALSFPSLRLSLYRDKPVTSKLSLGVQYLLDWQSSRIPPRSLLASYGRYTIVPGFDLHTLAGLPFDAAPGTRQGILFKSELRGTKSWHGLKFSPQVGVIHGMEGEDNRLRFQATPRISTELQLDSGITLTPYGVFSGAWQPGEARNPFEPRLELGLNMNITPELDASITASSVKLQGLRDSEISGSIKFRLPLGGEND